MRKFLIALGITFLLVGCGDSGIYGTYKNEQTGQIMILEKNKAQIGTKKLIVKNWGEKGDEYTGFAKYEVEGTGELLNTFLYIQKQKNGNVIYEGVEFVKQ
jgi:hypothetical protein